MKTEYLEEFVVLAQRGSFGVAADELFISQSSLSGHIKAMEDELGFSLIDRAHENELTVPGLLFLDVAQSVLLAIDTTVEKCRRCDSVEEASSSE